MAAFGIIPTISRDCRTITLPDVFNSDGDFNLSLVGAVPTAASLVIKAHNETTSTTVNVLNDSLVDAIDITVDGTDIIFQPADLTRLDDAVWFITFTYTYIPAGLGSVTEVVCLCRVSACSMLKCIIDLAKKTIGDPECIKCGDVQAECSSLDLIPLYDLMYDASDLDLCYQAAEFFEFINLTLGAQNCKTC